MTLKAFNLSLLIIFASYLASLQAQSCNNPLLEIFNLAGLSAPVSGASLPFCSNLQAGDTCCSEDTVRSFQTLLDNNTAILQNAAGSRDNFILDLYEQFMQQYQAAAGNLSLLATQIDSIQSANTGIGTEIASERDAIAAISTSLTNLNNTFQTDFQNYQNARANCFTTVLKVQASVWCLACDPNFATQGVLRNGTIIFSPNLCSTISQACYPFLAGAAAENPLYQARQSLQRLQNLLLYIANFTATGTLPNRALRGDILSSTNATERTVGFPTGCADANNCPWQCQNLFSGEGVMNPDIVANGAGVIGANDINFPAITRPTTRRMLQNVPQSAWNPNIDGTGLVVVVVPDPAGTLTTGRRAFTSGMRFGATSVLIGLLIFVVQIML